MLTEFVSVYVPSTRHSVPIPKAEHIKAVKAVATKFSIEFGGATTTDGIGYWQSPEFGLIAEPVTIVKGFYEDTIPAKKALRIARQLARTIKRKFQQEAVTIETKAGIDFV